MSKRRSLRTSSGVSCAMRPLRAADGTPTWMLIKQALTDSTANLGCCG